MFLPNQALHLLFLIFPFPTSEKKLLSSKYKEEAESVVIQTNLFQDGRCFNILLEVTGIGGMRGMWCICILPQESIPHIEAPHINILRLIGPQHQDQESANIIISCWILIPKFKIYKVMGLVNYVFSEYNSKKSYIYFKSWNWIYEVYYCRKLNWIIITHFTEK